MPIRYLQLPRLSRNRSRLPQVAVMILNYNGLKWLPRCLSSLLNTKYPNCETYLIDNGSSDGSAEYVRQKYPSVKVIRNSRNLGFAEAYNRAISRTEAEYVVLLNNDTEVLNPKWLNVLVKTATEESNVAAVATKMVSMENHRLLDSVGSMGIPYWRGFVDIGKGEPDADHYSNGFEPFAFCGGAALIRRSAFTDAGKFDGKFFLYAEDPDLSWRLRLLGWKIPYAPDAKVAHALGESTGGKELTPLRLYFSHRNLLRSIIKNCGSSLQWALRNYFLFTFIIIWGFLLYEPRNAIVVLKGIVWNMRNFRSSYATRLFVQSRRKVGEQEVLRRLFPSLKRKQPEEHASLRRILNVLFEYSNRAKFQAATHAT